MDEEDRLDFGEEEDLEDQISLGEADIDAKEDQDQDITQTRESSTNDNSGHGGLSHAAAGSAAGATASIDSKVDGADEAPLPPGWVARLSRQGELYYLHEPTKQSTWDRPTETVESSVSSPRAPEQSAVSDDTTTGTAKNKEKAAAAKTQPGMSNVTNFRQTENGQWSVVTGISNIDFPSTSFMSSFFNLLHPLSQNTGLQPYISVCGHNVRFNLWKCTTSLSSHKSANFNSKG